MGLVPIRGFEIQDASARVRSVLPAWKPGKAATRAAAAKKLRAYLAESLEGYPVSCGREITGVKSDLTVAEEVLVEFQIGFRTSRDYEKLVKRLDTFKHWGAVILVILLGPASAPWLKKLDDHVNFLNNDLEWTNHKDIVILRK